MCKRKTFSSSYLYEKPCIVVPRSFGIQELNGNDIEEIFTAKWLQTNESHGKHTMDTILQASETGNSTATNSSHFQTIADIKNKIKEIADKLGKKAKDIADKTKKRVKTFLDNVFDRLKKEYNKFKKDRDKFNKNKDNVGGNGKTTLGPDNKRKIIINFGTTPLPNNNYSSGTIWNGKGGPLAFFSIICFAALVVSAAGMFVKRLVMTKRSVPG